MNVTSLRSNVDQNAQSAEIRVAKVALANIALWVAMWTPYAGIHLPKKKKRKVDLISLSPRSDCFARSCWKSSEDYSIGYYFASFDLQICFNRQSCCIRNFASKISLGMNCVYHE